MGCSVRIYGSTSIQTLTTIVCFVVNFKMLSIVSQVKIYNFENRNFHDTFVDLVVAHGKVAYTIFASVGACSKCRESRSNMFLRRIFFISPSKFLLRSIVVFESHYELVQQFFSVIQRPCMVCPEMIFSKLQI